MNPLVNLVNLENLWLDNFDNNGVGNSVSDLRPLAGLNKLTLLDLSFNSIIVAADFAIFGTITRNPVSL